MKRRNARRQSALAAAASGRLWPLRPGLSKVWSRSRVGIGRVGLWAVLGAFAAGPALAQDWTQWRGPKRNGHTEDQLASVKWPSAPEKLWSVEVGGGHASPVAKDGRVFVHSRQGGQEVVTCLGFEKGKQRWQQHYEAPYTVNPSARDHGPGPKSTPVLHEGRLYTLGISGILSSWDAKTGERLWQRRFDEEFKTTSPLFGTAMSPLVAGDLVYAHVGGHDDGALRAFDRHTGQTRWSWDGDGPGYSSPILVRLDSVQQLVTQTQQYCIGLDPATGQELWKVPFNTPYYQNSVTPVRVGGLVIFSGIDQGVFALKPRRTAEGWVAPEVWRTRKVSMYMSSPVVAGGRIYGFSHFKRGQLFALEAATGKVLWTGPSRRSENASLIVAGRWLLSLAVGAEMTVLPLDGLGTAPIARHRLATSPVWAHPAPAGSGLLVKDAATVARWRFAD